METQWQAALSRMTYGIYVLTTAFDGETNGMIASWVSQISHEPPLILTAVHPNRYSHGLIEKSGAFALHVLGKDRKDFLKRFKGPDPMEKFSGINWRKGKTGAPILTDCLAWMECRVEERFKPGNHTLFIGRIVDAQSVADTPTLSTLDYEGCYTGKS